MNTNNEQKTTALAVAPAQNMTALQLCANMQSVTALGHTLAQSGFFGVVSASTATAALVNCFLEGLTPLQYKAKYHTFDNGQTGVKSDYIQREFHKLGGEWEFVEWTPTKCDMRFTYKERTMPFCVTLDEFKENGVAMKSKTEMKATWAKFPREMLKARCMATAIRAICPEALDGMYTQEEVADFATAQNAPVAAKVDAVSPSPIAEDETKTSAVNYAVCPCGSVKGKPWTDIATEKLEAILATPAAKAKALTAEHRNAIVEELGRREAEMEGDAGEIVDAEVVKVLP